MAHALAPSPCAVCQLRACDVAPGAGTRIASRARASRGVPVPAPGALPRSSSARGVAGPHEGPARLRGHARPRGQPSPPARPLEQPSGVPLPGLAPAEQQHRGNASPRAAPSSHLPERHAPAPAPAQAQARALSDDALMLAAAVGLLAASVPAPAAALALAPEPGNALSLPTWVIHVASVVEWVAAMGLVWQYGAKPGREAWRGLTWAMVPLLLGAMCACTWHFYYNAPQLEFLVALQSFATLAGNCTLCFAAYRIYNSSRA